MLLAPFVVCLIVALIAHSRKTARRQYRKEIIGQWRATSGSDPLCEFSKDGSASVTENGGNKRARTYQFIDDNHIRIDGPDLPRGIQFVYEVAIVDDELSMLLKGGNDQAFSAKKYKRLR